MAGAALAVYQQRREFDPKVLKLTIASIIFTIFAELFFTFYISVFGFSNLMATYLKPFPFI